MAEKPTSQDAINVIALNGNDLNRFVKVNHISTSKFVPFSLHGSSVLSFNNLIIDYVIGYFRKDKSSHLKEAREMYGHEVNRYKTLPNIKDSDLEQEKAYIFGTEEKYQKFLNDCFEKR